MESLGTLSQPPAQPVDAALKAEVETTLQNKDEYGPDFKRIPFGNPQTQLAASQLEGYHLHWINDWHPQMTDRLQQAQNAGYRFVSRSEVDHSPAGMGNPTTDLSGERVSRTVGTRPDGSPITAYLMKIPEEWWLEHQKQIWDRARKVDQAIKRGAEGTQVERGYVPRHDKIVLSTELRQKTQGESE